MLKYLLTSHVSRLTSHFSLLTSQIWALATPKKLVYAENSATSLASRQASEASIAWLIEPSDTKLLAQRLNLHPFLLAGLLYLWTSSSRHPYLYNYHTLPIFPILGANRLSHSTPRLPVLLPTGASDTTFTPPYRQSSNRPHNLRLLGTQRSH